MGVVFEVAADYIKIVALQEVNNKSFDEGGWIEITDAQYFLDKDDGSQNKIGLEQVISNYAANYNSISDYPAFDFCNNYSVLSDSSDIHTWYLPAFYLTWNYYVENAEYQQDPTKNTGYIPAINELETIVKDTTGEIATALSQNGSELTSERDYWSSTLVTEDTVYSKTAYYLPTKSKVISQYNVDTACYVRPVKKITLE